MSEMPHHASVTVEWNFWEPPFTIKGSKIQLLTIGGIAVTGTWYGAPGEYFVAWAPLLKIDKDKFNAVIDSYNQNLPKYLPK
jgi:hypothetical protein